MVVTIFHWGVSILSELTAEQQKAVVNYLLDHLEAHTIILFGSAAKGRLRPDSDVDIAFMSDRKYSVYDLFVHAQELADVLGREVDLVDFRQASTVFKAQIVGTGKVVLDRRPYERQIAFMQALKEYALLNEERAEILAKFPGGDPSEPGRHHEQDGDHSTLPAENR